MLARLALLFVVVPLVELALLLRMGQWVGLWPTVGLVIGTGVLGAALARAEGLRTLAAFQREVASGALPGRAILDGLSVLVGGALLLTPGLLTDLFGFALLLPPSRRWIQRRVKKRLEARILSGDVHIGLWTTGSGGSSSEDGARGSLDPRHEIRREEPAER